VHEGWRGLRSVKAVYVVRVYESTLSYYSNTSRCEMRRQTSMWTISASLCGTVIRAWIRVREWRGPHSIEHAVLRAKKIHSV